MLCASKLEEQDIWKNTIKKGFEQGIQQANQEFSVRVSALDNAYQGMFLYTLLAMRGQVAPPRVVISTKGVSKASDGQKMAVGVQKEVISQKSYFVSQPNYRKPIQYPYNCGTEVKRCLINTTDFTIRIDLDSILMQAYQLEVSDVHIGGEDPIKVRCHGVIQNLAIRTLNTNEVGSLLIASYDDNPSAPNQSEFRRRAGFFLCVPISLPGRISTMARQCRQPPQYGQRDIKIVFRAIKSMPPDIETLGVEPDIIELTTNIKKGLVVVTGATGSGKSTLLASILRRRAELGAEHMITAEAIEYVYDGIETQSCITAQEIGRGGDHKTLVMR